MLCTCIPGVSRVVTLLRYREGVPSWCLRFGLTLYVETPTLAAPVQQMLQPAHHSFVSLCFAIGRRFALRPFDRSGSPSVSGTSRLHPVTERCLSAFTHSPQRSFRSAREPEKKCAGVRPVQIYNSDVFQRACGPVSCPSHSRLATSNLSTMPSKSNGPINLSLIVEQHHSGDRGAPSVLSASSDSMGTFTSPSREETCECAVL